MAVIIVKSERVLGYVCEARIVFNDDDQTIARTQCGQEISDRGHFEDTVQAAEIHVDQCEGPGAHSGDYGAPGMPPGAPERAREIAETMPTVGQWPGTQNPDYGGQG